MIEDELAEALAQFKQALEEEVRLVCAYNQAKNKDQALAQAKKETEEIYSKYCDAEEAWSELNKNSTKSTRSLLSPWTTHTACGVKQKTVSTL
ncbi:hypothetical protein HMPREF0424_0964 [Gardnerella vaginalis 409-05]|nr:hypothetical protein HMPREF0424_0964 [Gardnerella vaginalis 409-05]